MKLMYPEFNTRLTLFIIVSIFNLGCSSALKNPYDKYYAIGRNSTMILDENNKFLMYINEGLIQLQLHGDVFFSHEKNEIYFHRKDVIRPYYIINEEMDDSAQIRIKFYSQSSYPLFWDWYPSLFPLEYSFFDQISGFEGVEIISKNEFILNSGFLEIDKSGFSILLDYEDLRRRGVKEVQILVSVENLFIKQKEFKGVINKNGFNIYWENGNTYKYRKKWRSTVEYNKAVR